MPKGAGVLVVVSVLVCFVAACGSGDDDDVGGDGDADADGDGDGDVDADGDADGDGDGDADHDPLNYFPLSVGTQWDYWTADPVGGGWVQHKEISGCQTITVQDCGSGENLSFDTAVWDSRGAAHPTDAGTAYIALTANGVERVMQEKLWGGQVIFTRRYSPGFLRFPTLPVQAGQQIDDQHRRCETDESTGQTSLRVLNFHWTVEANEAVDVRAGHFDDCWRMRRADLDDSVTKLFWFCSGVGKVLEHTVDDTDAVTAQEELTAYTIGTDPCPL